MATPQASTQLDRPAALEREITLPFLAGLLDALPNPVFVKDERHRWVLLNDRFCRLVGREPAELIGHSDYDFFPRAEADEFWRRDDQVFATGRRRRSGAARTGSSRRSSRRSRTRCS